jgi:thiamine biosynthesis lipoprotein
MFGRMLVATIALWAIPAAGAEPLRRYQAREPHMGVDVTITLYAPSEAVANDAVKAAFQRIAQLNKVFSDYDPESEAMRLCAIRPVGQSVPISKDLFVLLTEARKWSEKTDGAFDVTVGPLVDLWRRSRRSKKLPTGEAIEEARQSVGYKYVRLLSDPPRAALDRENMKLDFGAIAKGYAADEAVKAMAKAGVKISLVAIAGDIAAGEAPPDAPGWKIGIAPPNADAEPSQYLKLVNACVSTSGDSYQYVEINDVRYSHIVDPRTGLGLTHRSSVTVVSHSGSTSDALDTAATILGEERGRKLIEETNGAAGRLIFGDERHATTTARFREWLWK